MEKAPVVVKSGLKKEEAEELMSKLTAGLCHMPHCVKRPSWCLLRIADTGCGLQLAARSAWSRAVYRARNCADSISAAHYQHSRFLVEHSVMFKWPLPKVAVRLCIGTDAFSVGPVLSPGYRTYRTLAM